MKVKNDPRYEKINKNKIASKKSGLLDLSEVIVIIRLLKLVVVVRPSVPDCKLLNYPMFVLHCC